MAWPKTLIFLILLTSCQSMRLIEICRIWDDIGNCAKKDKQYTKPVAEMIGYAAWDDEANDLLGSRLEQCEQDGKLPWSDRTWEEMRTCEIGRNCGQLEGLFATDSKGQRMIKDKLDWCKR